MVKIIQYRHFSCIDNTLLLYYISGPRLNGHHIIGRNFCIESIDTIEEVSITCPLENDPSPPTHFNMTVTRISNDNSTENMFSSPTMNVFLNNSLLMLLFSDDTLNFNVNCRVSNSFGNSTASSTIQVCGTFSPTSAPSVFLSLCKLLD